MFLIIMQCELKIFSGAVLVVAVGFVEQGKLNTEQPGLRLFLGHGVCFKLFKDIRIRRRE